MVWMSESVSAGQGLPMQCTEAELEVTVGEESRLQRPKVDETELEDARWFHWSWIARQLSAKGIDHPISAPQPMSHNHGAPP